MIETAEKINREYSLFYNKLLSKGRFPMRETPLGYWGYSIGEEIVELFKAINLQQYSSFVDLGSGDGKVVNLASLFTHATGIEADRELIDKSLEVKKKFGLDKAEFIHGDFMYHTLSGYDLLFIYPDKRLTEVEEKLLKEMRGYLIVMGLHFHPLRLKKERSFYVGTNLVSMFSNQFKPGRKL